jgi:neopullulanase
MEPWNEPPTVRGFKGGDLPGVVERLDYLVDLGVNALYLNPVFASPSNHRYHTYDYLRVDPLLGGNEALRGLLDAAHERGMRVILDGVFNHSGRGFWPFHHILEAGRDSPYLDWFHIDRRRLEDGRRLDAYSELLPPDPIDPSWAAEHRTGARSFTELGYRAWWDLPALPKLNLANPEARAYILMVAEHWTRFGVDGWRLDVPEEVDREFWDAFRERVRAVNPDAYLVGEIWHAAPDWTVPRGPFDGLMSYPLAWAIIGFAAGRHLDRSIAEGQGEMAAKLFPIEAEAFVAEVSGHVASCGPESLTRAFNVLGSHDTPRLLTVCGGDLGSAKLAMLLLMVMPGAPCIYYGDEIGMRGGPDPGCRAAFDWDSTAWSQELRDHVRRAIATRIAEPALREPQLEVLAASESACLLRRGNASGGVWVAVNAGDSAIELPLPLEAWEAQPMLTVGSAPTMVTRPGGASPLMSVPPRSGALLRPHT